MILIDSFLELPGINSNLIPFVCLPPSPMGDGERGGGDIDQCIMDYNQKSVIGAFWV